MRRVIPLFAARNRPQRVQTFQNINGIGQLIIILTQGCSGFGACAVFFDLADFILGQAVIRQRSAQAGFGSWCACLGFFLIHRARAGLFDDDVR